MEVIAPTEVESTEQKRPVAIWSPHPMMPSHGRQIIYETFLQGESVGQYLERTGIFKRMGNQSFVLTINGRRIPRQLWWKCYPKVGTQIGIYAVMHGGGGDGEGGGKKNPLATVAMILVVAVATYFFGPGGAAGAGAFWSAAGYAAVVTAGSLLVNQIFPPPKPKLKEKDEESPTYAIGGGSNQMRRYEPFPKICGIHRVFPDFGAQPYTEPYGDDQIGFYVFDFGYNDLELSEFKIGAAVVDSYTGVQIQVSSLEGGISLFPGNVDTTQGATLDHNDWIQRTTSADTVAIGVDIGGQLYYQSTRGIEPLDVKIGIEYRKVGDTTWIPVEYIADTDPEIVEAAELPYGKVILPFAVLDTLVRPIWEGLEPELPGEIIIVSMTRRPILRSFTWRVEKGQYEVRVRRAPGSNAGVYPEPDPKKTSEIFFTQLRSYQPDTVDYSGRKRVGMRIKASGQLNNVIDQFSAVARARAMTYNTSTGQWSRQVTSNPAWWVLDIARGRYRKTWLELPGVVGAYVSTPDSATVSVPGDLDVRVRLAADDWSSNFQCLVSKWDGPSNQRSWVFELTATGALKIHISPNGSTATVPTSTVPVSFLDGTPHWVRVTVDVDNGAGGRTTRFYTSEDGVSWTQLGDAITEVGAITLFDNDQPIQLGMFDLSGLGDPFKGKIYYAEVRAGIDGTVVAKFDPALDTIPGNPSFFSGTGELWTLQGQAVLKGDVKVWGGGLTDNKLDIENIKLFAAWCDEQGLTFNAVFDQQISIYDMMTAAAIMGRGTLTWASGKLGVVWDAPNQPIVGVFGMHNILPDTFEVEYTTENLAEVVEGEFINPDLDWQTDYVRVPVPGATSNARVVRIPLFGRTNKELAGQDVNLYAAQNFYRNRRYRWQSDWEAMPVSRGDVIELAHDLAALDYSGRFIEGGDALTLKLPREVPLYAAGSFIVVVRPDGERQTFSVAGGSGDTDTLTLTSPIHPDYNPYTNPQHPPYDYRWLYGSTSTPGKKLKVESFKPVSSRIVEIGAIDELDAFYNAKNGVFEYNPVKPVFGGSPNLRNVLVTAEGVRSGLGYVVKVSVTWEVTGDYGFADISVALGAPPSTTAPILTENDIRGRSFEFFIQDNTTVSVTVTAYSSLGRYGKSSSLTNTQLIAFAASKIPENVQGFQIDGDVFKWTANEEEDIKGYVIRFHYGNNQSWGDANPLHQGFITGNAHKPPVIPPGVVTFMIKAVDAANLESALPAVIVKDLGDSPIANVLETIDFTAQGYDLLDTYAFLPGTSGNYVSTPDSPAVSITGDIDIRCLLTPVSWANGSSQSIHTKWGAGGTSWAMRVSTDGRLELFWDDGTHRNVISSVVVPFADGSPGWVRATLDVNNGGGGHTVTFFTSTDYNPYDGSGNWTQLGTTQNAGAFTTSIADNTQAINLSGITDGGSQHYAGKYHYAELLNGINGTIVATFNPVRGNFSATQVTGDTGEVWTVNSAGTPPNTARIIYGGTLEGGSHIGTDLTADSTTSFYNVDENVSMYTSADSDPFYKQDLFRQMIYTTAEFSVNTVLVGSQAVLDFTILGQGIVIEYRQMGSEPAFGPDSEPFYGEDNQPFYQEPPAFVPYTGPFVIEPSVYQFRVTTAEGGVQGVIDEFVLTIDAPDKEDRLDDVSISAAGTRLPITANKFTSIKNVQLTIQADGGAGVTAEILDKDISGPLVKVFDSTHTAVNGLVDAVVKGY